MIKSDCKCETAKADGNVHKATIRLSKSELKHYREILAMENADYDALGVGELSRYVTLTAEFDDGRYADINVNSNAREDGDFFAEIVLYDENGEQNSFSDPQYEMKPKWDIESDDGQVYEVEVVAD
jgi:hypothetical protein